MLPSICSKHIRINVTLNYEPGRVVVRLSLSACDTVILSSLCMPTSSASLGPSSNQPRSDGAPASRSTECKPRCRALTYVQPRPSAWTWRCLRLHYGKVGRRRQTFNALPVPCLSKRYVQFCDCRTVTSARPSDRSGRIGTPSGDAL